jgi:hypothetical protein
VTTTTDDYIVKEICKLQSEVLATLDTVTKELLKIDAGIIAELPNRIEEDNDALVMLHEWLKNLNTNLGKSSLAIFIFAILSKSKEEA